MKPDQQLASLTEIEFDLDLLDLHASNAARYPFLLESAAEGTTLGRFDILFAFPQHTLRMDSDFEVSGGADEARSGFLDAFDSEWGVLSKPERPGFPLPFRGGWFVFLGYELATEIEPRLNLTTQPGAPVAMATRIPAAVIRDRKRSRGFRRRSAIRPYPGQLRSPAHAARRFGPHAKNTP